MRFSENQIRVETFHSVPSPQPHLRPSISSRRDATFLPDIQRSCFVLIVPIAHHAARRSPVQELSAHDPHRVALHRGTVRGPRYTLYTSFFCNFFATFAANLPPADLNGGLISHDGNKSGWFKLKDWNDTSCSESKFRLREK